MFMVGSRWVTPDSHSLGCMVKVSLGVISSSNESSWVSNCTKRRVVNKWQKLRSPPRKEAWCVLQKCQSIWHPSRTQAWSANLFYCNFRCSASSNFFLPSQVGLKGKNKFKHQKANLVYSPPLLYCVGGCFCTVPEWNVLVVTPVIKKTGE